LGLRGVHRADIQGMVTVSAFSSDAARIVVAALYDSPNDPAQIAHTLARRAALRSGRGEYLRRPDIANQLAVVTSLTGGFRLRAIVRHLLAFSEPLFDHPHDGGNLFKRSRVRASP
jgi:hypothetical protein